MHSSQSLVVVDQFNQTRATNGSFYQRPDARFLAHLIAVRSNSPEMRLKNRASPEYGIAAYRQSDDTGANKRVSGLRYVA